MYFFFYYEAYIAILGKIPEKNMYHQTEQALKKLNLSYKEDFSKEFYLVQENEFHGLLKNGAHLMDMITELEMKLYPCEILWGIGIGRSKEVKEKSLLWEVDNQAFQNAKEASNFLIEQNQKSASFQTNYHIVCDGDNQEITELLNTSLMLLSSVKRQWSRRQYEIASDCLKFHDGQTAAAKRLGITQSSVQKGLAGADFYTYQEAVRRFSEAFSQIR
ncbi:SatD family protein [Anaerostipes sp. MSJ-23]|uniref:SatD family protein n=1 Tax=Anaerostipes sp. MSJ-23 TaxID=2841520 RepID=UPI001C110FC6|nr:SatD family protein [Anaerostipes sp. MSJ-23]MBU5459865.1 SatD family protein [Anaerostipes sp. MSJ-23]